METAKIKTFNGKVGYLDHPTNYPDPAKNKENLWFSKDDLLDKSQKSLLTVGATVSFEVDDNPSAQRDKAIKITVVSAATGSSKSTKGDKQTALKFFIDGFRNGTATLSIKYIESGKPSVAAIELYLGTIHNPLQKAFLNDNKKPIKIQTDSNGVGVLELDLSDIDKKFTHVTASRDTYSETKPLPTILGIEPKKSKKTTRFKTSNDGEDIVVRAGGGNSSHSFEIETYSATKKPSSELMRISADKSITIIDKSTGNILKSDASGTMLEAKDVEVFIWKLSKGGWQKLGVKFAGVRELSLRLAHIKTGEAQSFKLVKR